MLEAYAFSREQPLLAAARRLADGLMGAARVGFLPALLRSDWSPAADWACLTGTAQIAHSWLLLFRETGEVRYLSAALDANAYVRRTVRLKGPIEIWGGVQGSFPVDGAYINFAYPNWAAKFLIDSLVVESQLAATRPRDVDEALSMRRARLG
jgi:hypothetical protein